MKKISFFGSVASIVALVISFVPFSAESEVSTNGSNSPAINNTNGDVNINYGAARDSRSKQYVARAADGGQLMLMKVPDFGKLLDLNARACENAYSGIAIRPLAETVDYQGIPAWRRVEVLEGPCAGKLGWLMHRDIVLE